MGLKNRLLLLVTAAAFVKTQDEAPSYILQCQKNDPQLDNCLTQTANFLALNVRRGINELDISNVEPVVIDEITLALGEGPDGYRATFNNIEAYGVSNLTVMAVRTKLDALRFQLQLYIPRIEATASYRSSGVLLVVQSSGGGDYWGIYEGVRAVCDFNAFMEHRNGKRYLKVNQLGLDFVVKDISMGIDNIHNGNAIIQAALNLFINTHAQELLKEMKPDLKAKMTSIMRSFMDNMFERIPYEYWIKDD